MRDVPRREGERSWIGNPQSTTDVKGFKVRKRTEKNVPNQRDWGDNKTTFQGAARSWGWRSAGDDMVEGSVSGFWDHVWPLHTLHPISSEQVPPPSWHSRCGHLTAPPLQVFWRPEWHWICFGMSTQWCSRVVGILFVCLFFSMSVGSLCDWREGRKDAGWSGHSWFRGRSKQDCWLLVKRAPAL